ncbi:MAG: hypothetical protein ACLQOO_26540 [Terriglobia bacterium]
MSFRLYAIGFVVVIGGLICAVSVMHFVAHWIVAGTIVLLGIEVLWGIKATRQKIRRNTSGRSRSLNPDEQR